MSALPPRSGESPRRGVSRLEMMQRSFQAKQLEEKEEKMIQMLEDKQERTIQRVNYGRDSANSTNSFSSSASSNSVTGGVGARPNMYSVGGGRVRQMFEQRRSAASPVGWDKSYPLDPVEAVNNEVRTPLYKQNVSRNNSYNKYSGNYGFRANGGTPGNGTQYGKRGMSLDRNKGRNSQLGYSQSMTRAHSQANIGNSSSEDSYTGSRPYSGMDYHGSGNLRSRKQSGGSTNGRNYNNYEMSPEESPPSQRKNYQTLSRDRDYTRPMPPTYRRQKSMSRIADPSPSRHSYHDSAYSSHSSQSSDNPSAFSVITPNSTHVRPPLSTQSSPSKTYSRQNSFNYDSASRTINSRTYRKQKSPGRHRSPSISPTRSAENSDETDLANNDDFATSNSRGVSRNAERAREEERRRMQVEMRKREQELLAKIKEQQKELDTVKAEKTKVEKELTRAEREREEDRRLMFEKEREIERQRIEAERQNERQKSVEPDPYRNKPFERVLNREKASPAHLRGRRPPSLSRLRGPSREASFDEDKSPVSRSSVKNRSTTSTYINGHSANAGNNTVKIDIKDAKKSVPPSPAPKKKTPSTPARRSLFAPKPRDDLVSCKNCGRNFAEDRIEKHQEICLKTAQKAKKRKVFDMTKARVKGTDAAKYVKSAAHLKNTEAKEQKKSDWRKKREDFINTLRAAKEAQKHLANGGSIKDLPPPPPMDTSDYIQCPHCNRRFAEAAAERHIPKCKDIKSNKRR